MDMYPMDYCQMTSSELAIALLASRVSGGLPRRKNRDLMPGAREEYQAGTLEGNFSEQTTASHAPGLGNSVDAVQPVPSPTFTQSCHTMGPGFLLKIVVSAERVQ